MGDKGDLRDLRKGCGHMIIYLFSLLAFSFHSSSFDILPQGGNMMYFFGHDGIMKKWGSYKDFQIFVLGACAYVNNVKVWKEIVTMGIIRK